MQFKKGLSSRTSIGANGAYRKGAAEDNIVLPTCIWRPDSIYSHGRDSVHLLSLDLPDDVRRRTLLRTWTGRTVRYKGKGFSLQVDLRNCLPGPLFELKNGSLCLNWAEGNDGDRADGLSTGVSFHAAGIERFGKSEKCLLITARRSIFLAVSSVPFKSVKIVSHRHWEIRLRSDRSRLLLLPLLSPKDIPRDRKIQKLWESLVQFPPRECEESYNVSDNQVTIRQKYLDSGFAPVPPLLSLAAERGSMVRLPKGTDLLRTVLGPFRVVKTDLLEYSVDCRWTNACLSEPTVGEVEVKRFPAELCYAGDHSWDIRTAMDRLLAWRTWGPLMQSMTAVSCRRFINKAPIPSSAEVRKELEIAMEPVSGLKYMHYRELYGHNGDISYDFDWYNGLSLSGLSRATECGIPEIEDEAASLAAELKKERQLMCSYFSIFADWVLMSSVMDPVSGGWNADCCHNGLEGLLGEYRLRLREGRRAEADRMLYLAARTGTALHSMWQLQDWLAKNVPSFLRDTDESTQQWLRSPADDLAFGIMVIERRRGAYPVTAATRNPYTFAGHYPELAAMIKEHLPRQLLKKIALRWQKKYPERYRDWCRFYIGDDWRKRWRNFDQEAREQAAVFFHLAPDICFRRLVLDQKPVDIARLFKTKLNAAEKVLLESGAGLEY